MQVNDRVYGKAEVNDPVLLRLIDSKHVQRLKGISQTGACKFIDPELSFSRYEHSMGVMILLKNLNAGIEEQIAGLLHDVPHTAFSHVVDFVFNNKKHDYHEQHYERIIKESEIPKILDEFNIPLDGILDNSRFTLLEQDSPALCADRIDYSLRAMAIDHRFDYNAQEIAKHFIVNDNRIVMNCGTAAKKFAEYFIRIDETQFSNMEGVACYEVMANAIRRGLKEKIITEKELFENDDYIWKKLKDSNDPSIMENLRLLHPGFEVREVQNIPLEQYDFCSSGKLRYVDPAFVDKDGIITTVSKAFPDFNKTIKAHRKHAESDHYIKIISRHIRSL